MLKREGRVVAYSHGRLSPPQGYALAIALVALGYLVRAAFGNLLPPGFPFLSFFPAVIISAYFGGRGPGIVSALLSGLASWYGFIPPFGSFALDVSSAWALGFFAIVTGTIIVIIDALQRTAAGLAAEREANRRLVEEQRTLFQELQHRVANNMMFLSGMLAIGRRRLDKDPAATHDVLESAEKRIAMMSRIHRRLYDPLSLDQPLQGYLTGLSQDLLEATDSQGHSITVDADPVRLDLERLIILSLLVTELATNAVKHAFPDGQQGMISLSLKRLSETEARLEVRDDGQGFDPAAGGHAAGLGRSIANSLAAQLGGRLDISSTEGTGTAASLTFPL